MPDVTVRYWAGAARAAGRDEETICAATVGELRAILSMRRGLAEVCAVASFLVNGQHGTRATALDAGSFVDVLPPFAGG